MADEGGTGLGLPPLHLHVGVGEALRLDPQSLHHPVDGGVEVRGALLGPLHVPGHLQVPQLLRHALPDGLDQVLSGLEGHQLGDLQEPLDHQGIESAPLEPWKTNVRMVVRTRPGASAVLPDRHDGEADDDVGDEFLPAVLAGLPAAPPGCSKLSNMSLN